MVIITTPNYINRNLKAFEINENIKDLPMGNGLLTERQLRPLTNLEPEIHLFIQSFEVVRDLSTIVDIPTNENQTRYLAQLDSDYYTLGTVKIVIHFCCCHLSNLIVQLNFLLL